MQEPVLEILKNEAILLLTLECSQELDFNLQI